MQLFMQTGLTSSVKIASDNGSNFTALTQALMKCIGCSPRFNTRGTPSLHGAVERAVGTVKNMINKVAYEHPKKWPAYLPYIMFAFREVAAEATGCPPSLLVYGRVCRGPLAILRETWTGQ